MGLRAAGRINPLRRVPAALRVWPGPGLAETGKNGMYGMQGRMEHDSGGTGEGPATDPAAGAGDGAASDPAAAFRKVVEKARARFVAEAPGRAAELEGFLRQIVEGPDPRAGLDGARALAHRIRGIAGTIGEAGLGEIAGEVESAADRMTAGQGDRDAEARRFVTHHRRLVQALRAL